MKPGWQSNKLSEVIDQFIVPQRDKPKVFDGNVPWCRIEDFDGRYLVKSKSGLKVSDELIKSMPLRVFPVDTVIVSCSADLGRCAIIKKPLVTNQTFIGLVPSNKIDSDFLYHLMTSMSVKLNNMASGATIKYLSKKKFQQIEIPIPPLSEQKQIVEILDKAFEKIDKAIANVERNIQNAEELFESRLNEIFSQISNKSEHKKLSEVTQIIAGGTPKSAVNEYWNGCVFWITPADMGKLKTIYVNNTSRKITELGLQKSSAKIFPKNSIILSTRAPIGYIAINEVPMSTNQGCKSLVPHKDLETKYLFYYLTCIKKHLQDLGTGTTFKELSSSKLKEVEIPICPMSEQKEKVESLDMIHNSVKSILKSYTKELKNLIELKKSILEKAFKGELTSAA